ncbi:MAG: DUF3137 domain-containing protein [Alphaproteobacteria bacterium]|nr:DUF3137 domain-containing protein [Alphaproteobacteria bacterium]
MTYINIKNSAFEILRDYEPERRRRLNQVILFEGFCFAVVALFFRLEAMCAQKSDDLSSICILAIIGLIAVMVILPIWYDYAFKKYMKKQCLDKILALFPQLKRADKLCDETVLNYSHLFGFFTEIEADDCFDGICKGISFNASELNLYTPHRGSREVAFNGIVLHIKTGQDFKSSTIITPKSDLFIRGFSFGLVSVLLSMVCLYNFRDRISISELIGMGILSVCLLGLEVLIFWFHYLQSVKTESIGFEKKYKIHTSNQLLARRLLTPVFMEKFYKMKAAFGTGNIKAAFFDNNVVFAAETSEKNAMFEFSGLFRPLDNPRAENRVITELLAVLDLVEYIGENFLQKEN